MRLRDHSNDIYQQKNDQSYERKLVNKQKSFNDAFEKKNNNKNPMSQHIIGNSLTG